MQKSLHLCSVCLHQWRVPQFALKYPCNPPPRPRGGIVTWRPSPPSPVGGDCCVLWGEFSRGGIFVHWVCVADSLKYNTRGLQCTGEGGGFHSTRASKE